MNPTANILVVDDTIENLRLLASMLGEQGYEVRPVTNGRQALQAVERDPPDLILLDINMPEMNGYEVCAALKSRSNTKDVPVIFLTALGDVQDKVRAFDVGGIDYITKPFQIEEVQARVKTHVALRRTGLELARSYERLEALERLRDDLVHMVVHDMRSPLTVLIGHLRLLRESAVDALGGEAAEDFDAATRAALTLNRMANDLLDVSRLEEQRLPLRLGECDVTAIAEDVAGTLRLLDHSRSIELKTRERVHATCDAEIIRRVLENLLMNAIKHTVEGDGIHVSVLTDERSVRVEVCDQGTGVPPESRERIFDKFESLATRAGGKYHSAGVGLAFCKLAVEAHGGTIGVRDGEPRGSIFWFAFPRGVPIATAASAGA